MGLHPINQGKLFGGEKGLRPCTPLGVMHLLDQTGIPLAGKKAVVIGRSTLVGRPLLFMLLERDATVTGCHSRTVDLKQEIHTADIVIPAIGQPGIIQGTWIKDGAVVIDVGISRVADGSLKGDVEFAVAKERAAFITPVPGGSWAHDGGHVAEEYGKSSVQTKTGLSIKRYAVHLTQHSLLRHMLKRTPLYETHRSLGARFTEFGGWDMPVQYTGILAEHRAVRTQAGFV